MYLTRRELLQGMGLSLLFIGKPEPVTGQEIRTPIIYGDTGLAFPVVFAENKPTHITIGQIEEQGFFKKLWRSITQNIK